MLLYFWKWNFTWTFHSRPQWPARSCTSCCNNCRYLDRGTRWTERSGTPPDRSQERREPDLSPQHLHWCAVTQRNRIINPSQRWIGMLTMRNLLKECLCIHPVFISTKTLTLRLIKWCYPVKNTMLNYTHCTELMAIFTEQGNLTWDRNPIKAQKVLQVQDYSRYSRGKPT